MTENSYDADDGSRLHQSAARVTYRLIKHRGLWKRLHYNLFINELIPNNIRAYLIGVCSHQNDIHAFFPSFVELQLSGAQLNPALSI